jgi:endo-1,4-beta-mannosidase
MFIPPWYQPPVVQYVPELATKLPYRKLQYPTYVKDIDLDAHIRVFEKTIKANGKTMEANIINMFGFTFKDNIFKWEKTTFKTIQIALLKN